MSKLFQNTLEKKKHICTACGLHALEMYKVSGEIRQLGMLICIICCENCVGLYKLSDYRNLTIMHIDRGDNDKIIS